MSQPADTHAGIALGATAAHIAHVNNWGRPTLCSDRHGQAVLSTPPLAAFANDRCCIGNAVWPLLEKEPELPVFRIELSQLLRDGAVFTNAEGRSFDPTAVVSLLLDKLRNDAEAKVRHVIDHVTIAVPSTLSDIERARLNEAAEMAGFQDVQQVDSALCVIEHARSRMELGNLVLVLSTASGTPEASIARRSVAGVWELSHAAGDREPFIEQIVDEVGHALAKTVASCRRLRASE